MKIILDTREQLEEQKVLEKHGIDFERAKLDCGDMKIITDEGFEAVIERKEMKDLIASMNSKRLDEQMRKLSEQQIPILIITGSFEEYRKSYPQTKMTASIVHGIISSCIVRYGLRCVIWVTPSTSHVHHDGVLLATKILKKIGENKLDKIRHRRVRNKENPCIEIVKLVCGVPANVATNLLKKFGDIYGILHASSADLLVIHGMGERRIEKMRKLVGGKHESL